VSVACQLPLTGAPHVVQSVLNYFEGTRSAIFFEGGVCFLSREITQARHSQSEVLLHKMTAMKDALQAQVRLLCGGHDPCIYDMT